MYNLSKEDIQAIAEELSKQQHASASASENPPKPNKGKTKKKEAEGGQVKPPPNLATLGLLTFWAVVFVILLIKLSPYI